MKKIAICLLAALTVMLWSCDTKKQKEDAQVDTSAQRIDSLENALAQAQNETNDLMGTVEQIRDGFTAINEAEDIITTQSAKGESSDRQAILSNMALIQKKMNLNRELIKNLQECKDEEHLGANGGRLPETTPREADTARRTSCRTQC